MLTGRGPHGRFEHLLTDGAVEIIFGVGSGRGEVLGHGGVGNQRGSSRRGGSGGGDPRPDSLRVPREGGESRQEAAHARKGAGPGRGGAERGDASAARARSGWPPELLLPPGGAGSAWRESASRNPELASVSPLLQLDARTAPPLPPGMAPVSRLKAAASRLRPLPCPTPKGGPGPSATPLLRLWSFSAFRPLPIHFGPHFQPKLRRLNPAFPAAPALLHPAQPSPGACVDAHLGVPEWRG